MYSYLKNTLLNFDHINIDDVENVTTSKNESTLNVTPSLDISFYDRIKIQKIKDVISSMNEAWFSYVIVPQNTTLEKISYDLYDSKDYWDILLLVNERMPIFDMYCDYDIISEAGETALKEYEEKIYRKKILSEVRERLRLKMQENYEAENENLKIVKYIQKNYIYDFIKYINPLLTCQFIKACYLIALFEFPFICHSFHLPFSAYRLKTLNIR